MSLLSKNYIQNYENYNKNFTDNSYTIINKYIIIINEYLKQCLDNIFIQNNKYFNYIIKKGISTISHVFKFLLLYTKNLDMIYFNCQKSYIYYIEFIGQIGEENNSFLQLNSKDAALFVYKKTIFEINNEFRKNFSLDSYSSLFLDEINLLIEIFNTLLFKLIEEKSLIEVIKFIDSNLQNFIHKIIKLYIDLNKNDNIDKLKLINIFIINCKFSNIFEYLEIFIKKIKKNKINKYNLERILLEDDYVNTSPLKYINSIILKSNI